MPQRLSWMPSCAQVTASMNSSQVPNPPGSMTKAAESSDISALRSCMVVTTCRSLKAEWAISCPANDSVMTPVARPPAAMTASATSPIKPTEAPP